MDSKSYSGPVPPYQANPSHPPPGPGGMVSPNHTGSYETSPPAVTHSDPYNQGPPPSHPPPGSSPTQYPHQPIAPLSNPPSYANQPPPGSPPVSPPAQISHAPLPAAMATSPPQEKHEYFNANPAGVPPQQAGIPMSPQQVMTPQAQQNGGYGIPATNVYHTVTPLASLGMAPAPVDCPVCHTRALTRTEQHSGNTTHAWAALVCFFTGCGCIPYLIRGLKDTEHYCGHCGVLLATWHNSGRTVVHQHG